MAAASISRALSEATDRGDDVESTAVACRIEASTDYYLGKFVTAASLGERAIEVAIRASPSYNIDFRYHHLTSARANQAKFLWMRGFADRARELISAAAEEAASARDPSSLVYVLCHIACPLALWLGDVAMADNLVRRLTECTEENALSYMRSWADWFSGAMDIRAGRFSSERHRLEAGFDSLRTYDRELLITIAPSLVDDRAVARADAGEAGWASAEILRSKGEKLREVADGGQEEAAETLFRRGLETARSQETLAWELRCATSLGQLMVDRGDRQGAFEVIGSVVDKFTEGFGTSDMRSALELMATSTPGNVRQRSGIRLCRFHKN